MLKIKVASIVFLASLLSGCADMDPDSKRFLDGFMKAVEIIAERHGSTGYRPAFTPVPITTNANDDLRGRVEQLESERQFRPSYTPVDPKSGYVRVR